MEIPAKNSKVLSIKKLRVTFTSGTNETPSFLLQYLLFSIFSFFFIKIGLKDSAH